MLQYDLTFAAQADLEEIARYTAESWGEKQAEQYAASLDSCFQKIAGGRAISRSFSAAFPEVRVTRCEHHFVFFVQLEGEKVHIIAILHERMQFIERLKHRLS